MEHAGIHDGDILVIDREVEVRHGDVVVASHAGGYVVCRYLVEEGQAWLYKDMLGEEDLAPIADFAIWGVVIFSVHNPNKRTTR
jgi:DNA polymerase V